MSEFYSNYIFVLGLSLSGSSPPVGHIFGTGAVVFVYRVVTGSAYDYKHMVVIHWENIGQSHVVCSRAANPDGCTSELVPDILYALVL